MASELETGLPSIRQIQRLIKDAKETTFKLISGEELVGTVMWIDPNCVCLKDKQGESLLLWLQAIAYIKPKP